MLAAVKSAAERRLRDQQTARELAWWGAMLPNMKRPPDLKAFADPPKKGAPAHAVRRMNDRSIFAAMLRWEAATQHMK